MKKVLAALFVTFTSLIGQSACASEGFVPENTIVIRGVIARETMGPVYQKMNDYLFEPQAPSEVNLIIDSPGGSVFSGFRFISQMKALQGKGTKFSCYVPGLAASMAFHILAHCDKRVVLDESALLWHRARVFIMFGTITAPISAALSRDLQLTDGHILNSIQQALSKDMSKEDIQYHFEQETLHIGQNLCKTAPHFCTSAATVPGLIEALQDKSFPSTEKPKEERLKNLFDNVEALVYVRGKFLVDLKQMLVK